MTGLTNDQIKATQSYIDRTREYLSAQNLHLTVSSDPYEWKDLLENAPGVRALASTFDPGPNDIPSRNMFWLALRNADGEAISCVGSRRFDTEDFINEWVTTWRLFGDETPHLEISTLDYVDTLPRFSGTVGYGGGLWVHPDFRGNDLAVQTSKLARVFTVRHFCADHYIVFVEGISEKIDWALNTLEWPYGANLSDGFVDREVFPTSCLDWYFTDRVVVLIARKWPR